MVTLVGRICAGEGADEEVHHWLDLLDSQIPLPGGYTSGLIFYPKHYGLGLEPSPEEIVDRMMAYRPIAP